MAITGAHVLLYTRDPSGRATAAGSSPLSEPFLGGPLGERSSAVEVKRPFYGDAISVERPGFMSDAISETDAPGGVDHVLGPRA